MTIKVWKNNTGGYMFNIYTKDDKDIPVTKRVEPIKTMGELQLAIATYLTSLDIPV